MKQCTKFRYKDRYVYRVLQIWHESMVHKFVKVAYVLITKPVFTRKKRVKKKHSIFLTKSV